VREYGSFHRGDAEDAKNVTGILTITADSSAAVRQILAVLCVLRVLCG